MIETAFFDDIAFGGLAKTQRILWQLTRQDMASMTGVSQDDIELFETDQSLSPTIKRKLLRVYDLIAETDRERKN